MENNEKEPKSRNQWLVKYSGFISGIAAGTADTCLNYPPYGLHYRLGRGTNVWQLKYWTPRELYRGVLAYSAIIPVTCIMDGVSQFLESKGFNSTMATFSSGMVAALLVSTPTGNMIVTDQRLSESQKPAGLKNSINSIIRHKGFGGFFTGIQCIAAREGVYSWAVFSAKNDVKEYMKSNDITASIIAGTIATIISQPLDTTATVLQNQVKSISLKEGITRMYKENGIKRFYRGFYFRWYAIVAGVFVMSETSEYVKSKLLNHN